MFYSCKSQFRGKNPILPFEKFPIFVLARNTVMLPHLIIQSSLHYLWSGRLREVKNKEKFQTFSYKSACGRLREVPNDFQTFGIWKTGRWGEVVAYETVYSLSYCVFDFGFVLCFVFVCLFVCFHSLFRIAIPKSQFLPLCAASGNPPE